ncbi:PH domain-containing protein [Mammaliicoccus sciuri]
MDRLIVFIKNYKYQLTFDEELLTVKYGLLTVQKRTVPIRRIQALKEEESIFRRVNRIHKNISDYYFRWTF